MDTLELCCAPTVEHFRLTADLRCAARLQRRRPPPCRQCESEHYLDWSLDAVGTDQRRQYINRPAVERTSKSGVVGRPAPSKPSRARIRRFAADRCCLDLSRSLRSSGSKHRKAPCRGARSALFGSARSQGVVCRERNDTGRRDGLVAGARISCRKIRLRAGSAFFPTNIVGRERTTLGVVGGVEPRATALFLGGYRLLRELQGSRPAARSVRRRGARHRRLSTSRNHESCAPHTGRSGAGVHRPQCPCDPRYPLGHLRSRGGAARRATPTFTSPTSTIRR